MNRDPLLRELYSALTEGLARPQHIWTVGVVVIALAIGWLGARLMRTRIEGRVAAAQGASHVRVEALRLSMEGLRRLAFPAITLGLLLAGEAMLRAIGVFRNADDARLLHLAITLLAAMAAIRLVVYILRTAFAGVAVLANFERALALFIWLVVALYLGGLLADVTDWLDATTLQVGKAKVSLWIILMGLLSLAVTVLAALWLGSLIEARLMRSQSLDSSLRVVLSRLTKALLLLLAVLTGLAAVGIDVTVLSVFGGALGVGLGLGLQRIASNYVSGFILLLDRSVRLGDVANLTIGTQALSDNALAALEGRRACLLANHGVAAIGSDIDDAFTMAEKVEALARLYWQALQVGEPVLLDAAEMATVLEKFGTYGRE